MTVGIKNKCSHCKTKVFGCKLKNTPHIHAEINGMEIVAKIHQNDALMKFLQKLESTPYEPSMKSLERKSEKGLRREKSYYNLRDRIETRSREWSRCRKCQSCTSWFRNRIKLPRKKAAAKECLPPSRQSLETSTTPTMPEKYPLVLHKDGKKKKSHTPEEETSERDTFLGSGKRSTKKSKPTQRSVSYDDTTTPYNSLSSPSTSSRKSIGKKSKKPSKKKRCKLFKSKRKKSQTSEEETSERDTFAGSGKRSTKKSKSKQKKGKPSTEEEYSGGDISDESKKQKKSSKRNRRKSKQKKGKPSTEEEYSGGDISDESKKQKKSSKRNRRKSKQDKKCQTSIRYSGQGNETKIHQETVHFARLMNLKRYQNYQNPKNQLITIPVLVNLKHFIFGKKQATENGRYTQ